MIKHTHLKILFLQFLTGITFSSALMIPFYFSNWVLSTEVFLLFWMYQLGVLLFEIPTWLFASKYGEKIWLSIWYFLMFLFFVLLNQGESFIYFAVLQLVLACAKAFQSGSVNTLIFDYAEKNEINHKLLRSNFQILWLVLWAITTILGGAIFYYFWYSIVFYIEALFFLVAVFYILSFNLKIHSNSKNHTYSRILSDSLQFLSQNKKISIIGIILYWLLWLEAWIYISLQDKYINWLHFPIEYLWLILTALTWASIIFTKLVSKRESKDINKLLIISLIIFLIASWFNYLYTSIIIFSLFFLTQIVRGINILVDDEILKRIDNWIWASVISLLGFSERLIFFLFSLIVYLFGISSLLLIFIISSVLLLIYFLYFNVNKREY